MTRTKLKLKPQVKIICKVITIILLVILSIFGYYLHCKNELKKAGYSNEASITILKKFKKSYALDNPDNKTLNKAFESPAYAEENLDYYKQIKFQNQKNLISNINTLIEKKYSARDITIILAHGNDASVTEFSKRDKVKYLEEFFSYDFAKLENYDRYIKYMNETGEDEETTIIKVNMDLDKEDYKDAIKVTDKSELVLANKHRYLGKEYVPNDLITIPKQYTLSGDNSVKATKKATKAAIEMIEAAKKEGLNLLINSGYRTYSEQDEIYNTYLSLYGQNYVERYVVKAGYSEHQTGYSFDFASANSNIFQQSKEYKWMIQNSYKYGFCYRFLKSKEEITGIRHEAWHFRYVGKEVAKKMDTEELSLEEYYAIYMYK